MLAAESIHNGARVAVVDVLGDDASGQGSLASSAGESSNGVEFSVDERLRDVLAAVSTSLGYWLAIAPSVKRGGVQRTPTMATLSTWLAIFCDFVRMIECVQYCVEFVVDFSECQRRADQSFL